jgi:PAS domain S-box-containing protein
VRSGRLALRLSHAPGWADHLLATAFAGLAVLARLALEKIAPGIAYFVVLLPAVVLAGAFCGTRPAAVAAAAGYVAVVALFQQRAIVASPTFNAAQVDALVFLPACAAVLWATSRLRRYARDAVAAEARLAEVFRQIPGAAAILEAPSGRLLLRSSRSDAVLDHGERPLPSSEGLAEYGGLHPDGRAYRADEYPIVRALKTGEVVGGERLPYRRRDGRVADLEVFAGPVRDPGGEIVAAVGMAFDVSARAEAERRLAQSEARQRATAERLSTAIEAGALGLWELDLSARRLEFDARVAEMLGLPAEAGAMVASGMAAFADADEQLRARRAFADALAAGAAYADEIRIRTSRGEPRWLAARGTRLADAPKVLGVVRDVTERRQREDALREALDARQKLMGEADHRIKNSLQLVVSLLRLQLGRTADGEARDAIAAAMTRVTAVADAHKALQHSPDLRSVEIDQILDELCGGIGLLNPDVEVRCEARAGLWLDAEVAIPMGLIASELLTNALRHAFRPGAPGTVTLACAAEDGVVRLTVADDGAGLPAGPYRAGLGTTVVRALTRQIGASLATESRPGGGTTARLELAVPATAKVASETSTYA